MEASFSNYLDLYISISGASSTTGATRRWKGSVASELVVSSNRRWSEM